MKIIKTAAFKTAATTNTKYESPEPEVQARQPTDLPQHRSSGEEHPEHHQVSAARLNRLRRNWREASNDDPPVVLLSHTIRIRTK